MIRSRGRAIAEMIQSSLRALETVHGFNHETSLYPSNNSQVFEDFGWRFWSKKAIVDDYFGVELLLIFDFTKSDHSPTWRLRELVVRDVYIAERDPERDNAVESRVPRYLSGEDFLAFLGKDFHSKPLVIGSAKDLLDLFEEYDCIAGFLGCCPIFFGV